MDLIQMLKNAQAEKPIESLKCQECNDTGRERNGTTVNGKFVQYIYSCTAGDREAKKRAEKQQQDKEYIKEKIYNAF